MAGMSKSEAKFWFNLGHKMQFSADFDETWAQYEASHGPDLDGLLEALEREGFVEELGDEDIEPVDSVYADEWAKEQGFPNPVYLWEGSNWSPNLNEQDRLTDVHSELTSEAEANGEYRWTNLIKHGVMEDAPAGPVTPAKAEEVELCGGKLVFWPGINRFICAKCDYCEVDPRLDMRCTHPEPTQALSKPRKEPEVELDPGPVSGAPVATREVCGGRPDWNGGTGLWECRLCWHDADPCDGPSVWKHIVKDV